MKQLARVGVVVALAVLVAACHGPTWERKLPGASNEPGAPFATLAANPMPIGEPYLLQVGDDLAVKFYNNPELNEEVQVRPDGKISLQLIDDIQAAGLSPTALDAELRKRYKRELADPQVTIIVKKFGGQRVYIGGEVGTQGVIDLAGGLTLFQAIQHAGGLTKTAHRSQVILIRKGADGRPSGRGIDLRPIQSGEHPEEDVPLHPYDIVFVPRSKIGDIDVFVEQYIRNVLPVSTFPVPTF